MQFKRAVLPAIIAVGILGAAGCGGSSSTAGGSTSTAGGGQNDLLAQIQKRGELRVFAYSFPPESGQNPKTGKAEGFDEDVWRYIAKQLNVPKVTFSFASETALGTSLNSGRIDAAIGHQYTKERAQVLTYSKPYWCVHQVVAVNNGSQIHSFNDLKGKTVGSVRGTAEDLTLTRIAKDFSVNHKTYDQADPMLRDLQLGRLQAVVWDSVLINYAATQNRAFAQNVKILGEIPAKYSGGPAKVYFLFPKNDQSNRFVARVNGILARIQSNGVLDGFFRQWKIDPTTMHCPV